MNEDVAWMKDRQVKVFTSADDEGMLGDVFEVLSIGLHLMPLRELEDGTVIPIDLDEWEDASIIYPWSAIHHILLWG